MAIIAPTVLSALFAGGCEVISPERVTGYTDADVNGSETSIDWDVCSLESEFDDVAYPDGPYGIAVGDRLESLTLDDCDGRPISFQNILNGSQLMLLNVAAGWCGPCIEETQGLEEEIFQAFCGRGLHVVQVVFEDGLARPATSLFCGQWRDRYGLTFPVLRDPIFRTEALFENRLVQTPLNLLIDSEGIIIYRSMGEVDENLARVIDEELP